MFEVHLRLGETALNVPVVLVSVSLLALLNVLSVTSTTSTYKGSLPCGRSLFSFFTPGYSSTNPIIQLQDETF